MTTTPGRVAAARSPDMRRALLASALWLATGACALAGGATPNWTPAGFCTLTVTSTAVALSSCSGGIPPGMTYAHIANEGAAYRWRDDGTAPTASVGQPWPAGTAASPSFLEYYAAYPALQFIAQGGTTTLTITFYK